MSDFTRLTVWQKSHHLAQQIYKLTSKLPREEVFGLSSQMRRAAVSIGSNIAEGESRYTNKDKLNFFVQSRSSAAELQSQLLLVADLYKDLAKLATGLKDEYDLLSKQINSLITFRRNNS